MRFSDTALLITTLKIDKYLPEKLPVSLNNLINDSLKDYKNNGISSELQIITDLPADDLLVKVDSDLLKTCFLMIIENSDKFSNGDARLNISLDINKKDVSIIFSDNGPGFSKTALESLFELFSSGDILHSEGTGLGLAAAKLILDAHEAKIDVKNLETKGAQVTIKLKYISRKDFLNK